MTSIDVQVVKNLSKTQKTQRTVSKCGSLNQKDLIALFWRWEESPLGCHRWIAFTPGNKMRLKVCLQWPLVITFCFPAQYTNKRLHDFCYVYALPAEFSFILQWFWAQSIVTPDKVPPFPSRVHLNRRPRCYRRKKAARSSFPTIRADCSVFRLGFC